MKFPLRSVGQRTRQRGIVAVMAVIFLITAVVFVLTQTLNITGTTSIDNMQQRNSSAALFLAESGLQRGQAVLNSSSSISNAVCTGLGGLTSYPIGAGSFTLSAESSPEECNSDLGPFCASCTIESTGTVNGSSRTVRRTISLTTQNGKGCNTSGGANCANPVMNLFNNFAFKSVALFNLAYDRQGQSVVGTCTATGCAPMWFVRAKQTNADMGNAVTIDAGAGYPIQASLTSTNYSFVGALFPGSSAAGPTIVGSYWSQQQSGNCCTTSKGGLTGTTNNGVDNNTDSLTLTPPVDASSTEQLAKSWCYGGDTMVYGFAGTGTSTSDQLSAVTFNTTPTSTSYPGNIPLTRVARYPNATSTDVPSNHDIYSEIWYVRNPDYLSTTSNASSGGTATGSIGAKTANNAGSISTFTGTGRIDNGIAGTAGTTLTLTASASLSAGSVLSGTGVTSRTYIVSGSGTTYTVSTPQNVPSTTINSFTFTTGSGPTGTFSVGDTLTGTGVTSSPATTITSFGTGTGGAGTYGVSQSQTVSNKTITAASAILYATVSTNYLSVGDTITSGGSITSGTTITSFKTGNGTTSPSGIYSYNISTSQTANNGVPIAITAAGKTIHLPTATGTPPSAGTIVKVRSGTGNFDAGATVTGSISGNTLTVTAVSSGVLSPGDRIFGINGLIRPLSTITHASGSNNCPTCTGTGGIGTYLVSGAEQTVASATIYARRAVIACTNVSDCFQGTGTISGTTLTISGTPTGNLSVGDTLAGTGLSAGTFITSSGGAGTYNIYPSQTVSASTAISAAPNASLFKISGGSQTPLTPLSGASICGGICAFFNVPSSNTSSTTFSITKSANTDYWSSGFMCLKGVDVTPPIQVFSSARTPAGWTEVLR